MPQRKHEAQSLTVRSEQCTCSSEEAADGGEGVLREAQTRGLEGFAHTAAPAAFSRARQCPTALKKDPEAESHLCPVTTFSKLPPLWPTFLATKQNHFCFKPERNYLLEKSLYKQIKSLFLNFSTTLWKSPHKHWWVLAALFGITLF